jgi:hypothetical protein
MSDIAPWFIAVCILATAILTIWILMARRIPKSKQKSLLRLISAKADVDYAVNAYEQFKAIEVKVLRYNLFLAMVVAYCRPFTANDGLGSLKVELPDWPDIGLSDARMRHDRMMILRNNFLSHSSIEGSKVVLLAPGATNPKSGEKVDGYRYEVAKLEFVREEYADWLIELINALGTRLDAMIADLVEELGPKYLKDGEEQWLDTGEFKWDKKQKVNKP